MKFLKDAEIASMSEDEQFRYERSLRTQRDALLIEKSMQLDKEEAFQDGLTKGQAAGEAKGRAEGEAKGRAEGEAKGRAEGEYRKALQIAEQMLRRNMPLDFVMEISGLDFDTVADLKNTLRL
jgi:predicted transposase YdaD